SANEKNVDRSIFVPILVHHRVDRREEQLRTTTRAAPRLQDRGKISKDCVIGGEVRATRRGCAPAERVANATRQLEDKRTPEAYGIEVVKNLGPMVFDLGEQDVFKRSTRIETILPRPLALQDVVVSIGKERRWIALQHGFKEMQRAEPVIQEDPT